ncbi:hypothetical protein WKW80_20140 [Variovorax humicola]|uniref:Uncharacterized protein n=1 Tax=Variovorax humicola TaxID=1769758 RepID=A0ABU8W4M3_9BURK
MARIGSTRRGDMNDDLPHSPSVARLTIARATAWALLLAGWVGLGGVALSLTPRLDGVYALVAAWLLSLGIAATIATRDSLRARARRIAVGLCAAITAATLAWSTHGGGLPALLVALAGWAGLTALASGVVRSARLAQRARPAPPIGAASLGAVCATIAIADPADARALSLRLGVLVLVAALALALLQISDRPGNAASRCRAGLFDCSLPAWPAGAWHDAQQWPVLLAGLAMLPMMAALPMMVAWCRAEAVAPQGMVALHFVAMFVPALLLRRSVAQWPARILAVVCTLLLASGAIAAIWASTPYNLFGVALAHGAAWSLAWTGQLWSPDRRSRQGTSPLLPAIGYAALTMAVGVVVERWGPAGLAVMQAALGLAAALAWGYVTAIREHLPTA